MESKSTKRRKIIKIAKTLVAVEREREREREREYLYRLNFLSIGTKLKSFSTSCVKIQDHCVCHLVNNKIKKYNEYIEHLSETQLICNGARDGP